VPQPQELLLGDVAFHDRRDMRQICRGPMGDGGSAGIVAADAAVCEVPLQHPAESTMLLSDRPRPHKATWPLIALSVRAKRSLAVRFHTVGLPFRVLLQMVRSSPIGRTWNSGLCNIPRSGNVRCKSTPKRHGAHEARPSPTEAPQSHGLSLIPAHRVGETPRGERIWNDAVTASPRFARPVKY
jgi:hypothetical protein